MPCAAASRSGARASQEAERRPCRTTTWHNARQGTSRFQMIPLARNRDEQVRLTGWAVLVHIPSTGRRWCSTSLAWQNEARDLSKRGIRGHATDNMQGQSTHDERTEFELALLKPHGPNRPGLHPREHVIKKRPGEGNASLLPCCSDRQSTIMAQTCKTMSARRRATTSGRKASLLLCSSNNSNNNNNNNGGPARV